MWQIVYLITSRQEVVFILDKEFHNRTDAIAYIQNEGSQGTRASYQSGAAVIVRTPVKVGDIYDPQTQSVVRPIHNIIGENSDTARHRDLQIANDEVVHAGNRSPAPRSAGGFANFRQTILSAKTDSSGNPLTRRLTHLTANGKVLRFHNILAAEAYEAAATALITKHDIAHDLTAEEWGEVLAAYEADRNDETEAAVRAFDRDARYDHFLQTGVPDSEELTDIRQQAKESLEAAAAVIVRQTTGTASALGLAIQQHEPGSTIHTQLVALSAALQSGCEAINRAETVPAVRIARVAAIKVVNEAMGQTPPPQTEDEPEA